MVDERSGEPTPEESERIGTSVEARPLIVGYCGDSSAGGLRIFILAGQHGDETDARGAASEYLAKIRRDGLRSGAWVAVLADANPDGGAAHRRRNASDVDLNRDHLLLRAPETRAVHSFVDRWRPDLIVDVHTYRPWRSELLQYGFVFPHDVMLDVPTNPAARTGSRSGMTTALLEFVKLRMAEASFRCDRYTLIRPSGIVRHSTVDILDARNSLSLRFGIPTVLIEGRRTSPEDPPIFFPPHLALVRSIEAVVEWAELNASQIKRAARTHFGAPIPVRCRYARAETPRYMELQSSTAGSIRRVGIPGNYRPFVRTTKSIHPPRAYAVPRSFSLLLEILARHHFHTRAPDQFARAAFESYRIVRRERQGPEEHFPAPADCVHEAVRLDLDAFELFPTDQPGGRALALFLEPASQFGLHRFADLALGVLPDTVHPVARVV